MPTRTASQNVRQPDVESSTPVPDDPGARTLRRGLQLLDLVMDAPPEGLRVVDLCRAAGLERATVHRLLHTLLESGHLARQGRFRLVVGPRLGATTRVRPGPSGIAARLQPVLAKISAASGDAAFAIVREGPTSHCIARQVGTHPVQILVIEVGSRQPLGVGAAGLALLAALPDEEVAHTLAANAPLLPTYGGMSPERMQLLVRATRERGWSLIGNHAARNILAVGMAVRDARGAPLAGISVASTVARMQKDRQQQIVKWMRGALAEVVPKGL
ncbi:MAG TPA: IclR family transcriptional regulator C-terminal domain-containing protein [Ideonella sp.]|uniref:IclR family transcriptional regulator n=1 Tax=Ideonella sp. TaxID=1929293 RepID=UPI002C1C3BE7|nr:IclR family transcriptional regulator C-terminal domain-containing protein [Ideonella sp.]HSI49741.1 IclR family transcriptional regulator C-terminal domain-containing protein [Ideonella sp.]